MTDEFRGIWVSERDSAETMELRVETRDAKFILGLGVKAVVLPPAATNWLRSRLEEWAEPSLPLEAPPVDAPPLPLEQLATADRANRVPASHVRVIKAIRSKAPPHPSRLAYPRSPSVPWTAAEAAHCEDFLDGKITYVELAERLPHRTEMQIKPKIERQKAKRARGVAASLADFDSADAGSSPATPLQDSAPPSTEDGQGHSEPEIVEGMAEHHVDSAEATSESGETGRRGGLKPLLAPQELVGSNPTSRTTASTPAIRDESSIRPPTLAELMAGR